LSKHEVLTRLCVSANRIVQLYKPYVTKLRLQGSNTSYCFSRLSTLSKWNGGKKFFHSLEDKPLTTASGRQSATKPKVSCRLYSIHFDQIHNGSGIEEALRLSPCIFSHPAKFSVILLLLSASLLSQRTHVEQKSVGGATLLHFLTSFTSKFLCFHFFSVLSLVHT